MKKLTLAALIFLSFLPCLPAFSFPLPDSFVVTNLSDGGSGGCTADEIGDGCSLREAITEANGAGNMSTITFQSGLTGTINLVNSLPDITSPITIQGPGNALIKVDGDGDFQIFNMPSGEEISLSDLTLVSGYAANGGALLINDDINATVTNVVFDSNTATSSGGAVYSSGSNVNFNHCTFTKNSAPSGGAMNPQGNSVITISDCVFTDNHATDAAGKGGAINNFSGDATISRCTFVDNSAVKGGALVKTLGPLNLNNCFFLGNFANGVSGGDGDGGAVYIESDSDRIIADCDFEHNGATGTNAHCGALHLHGSSDGDVNNCTFLNNTAFGTEVGAGGAVGTEGDSWAFRKCTFGYNEAKGGTTGAGGAVVVQFSATPTFQSCTFDSNKATGTGTGNTAGGGAISEGSDTLGIGGIGLNLAGCTMMNNSANGETALGGGIYMKCSDATNLTNCTFYGNAATGTTSGLGGALNTTDIAGYNIKFCTFAGNSASTSGGAMHCDNGGASNTGMHHSIVWGNTAPAGADIYRGTGGGHGGFQSSGYNIVKVQSNVAITAATGDHIGDDTDPKLDDAPKNNGGPTYTIALLSGSPAIDGGDPAYGETLPDQRGVQRPKGSAVDIGAFESVDSNDQPGRLVVTVTENDDDGNYAADDISLREAMKYAGKIPGSTITFDIPGDGPHTITLTEALPDINASMNIEGPLGEMVTVERSTAGDTPAFRIFNITDETTVEISRLTVSNGDGGGFGGGIQIGLGATVTLNAVSIVGNHATIGGGVYNKGGNLLVRNSLFSGNSCTSYGGGLQHDSGTITIVNSTFSGNTGADSAGGGLSSDGNMYLDSVTVTKNSMGGVFAQGEITARNCIIAENTNNDVVGGFKSDGYNFIGGDPQLEDLADNGGPTKTHALKSTSPALDTGYTTLDIDQRGTGRPIGNGYDIGAFELSARSPENHAPVLNTIPQGFVNAGEKFSYNASSSDPDDGDIRTYSLGDGAPVGVTIDPSSGLIQWQTSYGTATGSYTFTVIVSDNHGGSDSQVVKVIVAPRRYAPVLAPIGAKSVNEETKLTIVLSATDQDTAQNHLGFYATNLPAGATFTAATKTFAWTPTEAQGPGSYDVTFRVNDGGLDDIEKVTITVKEVNKAPVLNVGAAKTFVGDKWNFFNVTATDADLPANNLTYSVTPPAAIAGVGTPQVNVNSSTGAISVYGPPSTANYTIPLSIKVTDNGTPALSDTKTLNVTITPPLVVWMVVPTFTATDVTLAYKLRNNSTKPLTNISIQGTAYAVVNSITKSVGTVTQQAQGGGLTGIKWNGFSLNSASEATLTIKLKRPSGSGKPVIGVMYPGFATAGNGTVPGATPVVNTP